MGSQQENDKKIEDFLKQFLPTNGNIVDLGTGKGLRLRWIYDNINPNCWGVEIFKPYIEISKQIGVVVIESTIQKYIETCKLSNETVDIKNQYSSYIMIDVLEHIEKQEGIKIINDLKEIGSRILIFSPNGICPQDPYDGNDYQKHLSTWYEQDLKDLGFQTWVHKDFHEGLPNGASADVVFAVWQKEN